MRTAAKIEELLPKGFLRVGDVYSFDSELQRYELIQITPPTFKRTDRQK